MKFAICNETYVGWSFERACLDAGAAGYDGIEVALNTIAPDPRALTLTDARDLAGVAAHAGLEVVGLHWLLKGPPGLHLTTHVDAVRTETVAYLEHLAALCAAMGGSVLVLGSPQQRDVEPESTYEEVFERAVDGCRRVAITAESHGITLALEPLGPAYTNFLTTAAEAVRVIEAVDHPSCALHLDVFAMSSEPDEPADIIRAHARHLTHFHANDTSLAGPGSGAMDYAPIVHALREVEYSGWVSVEVFDMTAGGPTIARESLAFLRDAFSGSA